jgi:hypothetical protein
MTAELSSTPKNDTDAFLRTFKAPEGARPTEFLSEGLGVAHRWKFPDNFNEHDLAHFLLDNKGNAALINKMYGVMRDKNPEIATISLEGKSEIEQQYHVLFGMASRFNESDIRFFVERHQHGDSYSVEDIRKWAIHTDAYGRDIDYKPSPETLDRLHEKLPPANASVQKAIDNIDRILVMYGEKILEFQEAFFSKSFQLGVCEADKHNHKFRRDIEALKPGDILRDGDEFLIVDTLNLGADSLRVHTDTGVTRELKITGLLARLEEVLPFNRPASGTFFEHYSADPKTLLPHHYVKEEQGNVFKSICLQGGVPPLIAAKAAAQIGAAFQEALTTVEPETNLPVFSMNHVRQFEVDGVIVAVMFLNTEEEYSGVSSVKALPITFKKRDQNTETRCAEAMELIEASVLAPPEDDGEMMSLTSQAVRVPLRPDLSPLMEAIANHPQAEAYPVVDREKLHFTAAFELTKIIQAIENFAELTEGQVRTLTTHANKYLELFSGDPVVCSKPWGQEVGDPRYSAAQKRDYEVSTTIDVGAAMRGLSSLSHKIELVESAAHPVSEQEFWHIAKEPMFCRCTYEDAYLLMANLNETGKSNVKALIDAGHLVIGEDIATLPGLRAALDVLNSETDPQKLLDFTSSLITQPFDVQSGSVEHIQLGWLIDGRNKAGDYCVLGSEAWGKYPYT